jgi:hypothetical protein
MNIQIGFSPGRRKFIRFAALSLCGLSGISNLLANTRALTVESESHGNAKISYLRTGHGKTFVVANGQPYLMYGIQLRIDHIVWGLSLTNDWTKADEYFALTRDVGFHTAVVPVPWSYIEPKEGSFLFSSYVDNIIKSANKYDLSLQLLWYGSDVCGFDVVPEFVKNDRARFPRTSKFDNFLDLTSANLIAAESVALASLMTHIAEIDKQSRVIMVQVENEPDGSGELVKSLKWGDPDDMTSKMYDGGQFDAIAKLLNTLGNVVHRSPRNVVTRCNVGTSYRALELYEAIRQAGSGLDIVGVDTYSDDPKLTKSIINTIPANTIGNVAHQPEGDCTAPDLTGLVLSDFEEGGGFMIYDIVGLYRGSESVEPKDWPVRDGTVTLKYAVNGIQRQTSELKTDVFRLFNQTVYKADKKITVAPRGRSAAFNVASSPGYWKEQRAIGKTSVTFETWSGSLAFAIVDLNEDLILLNLTASGLFTVDPQYAHSPASTGYFDQENVWREQSKKLFVGNLLNLSGGDVVRLVKKPG